MTMRTDQVVCGLLEDDARVRPPVDRELLTLLHLQLQLHMLLHLCEEKQPKVKGTIQGLTQRALVPGCIESGP